MCTLPRDLVSMAYLHFVTGSQGITETGRVALAASPAARWSFLVALVVTATGSGGEAVGGLAASSVLSMARRLLGREVSLVRASPI